VSIANALQLKVARRHIVFFRFNYDAHVKFEAVLERSYCWYVTFRCDLKYLDEWPTCILNNTVMNQTKLTQDAAKCYGVGHFCPTVLRGAWTQLHQTWRGHNAIMTTQEMCISVRISSCIFKHVGSKWSCVENNAKFRTFWPLWKFGEGWARSLYQLLLKLHLRPNLRNAFDSHPLRSCWARWIDREKERKKVQQAVWCTLLCSSGLKS